MADSRIAIEVDISSDGANQKITALNVSIANLGTTAQKSTAQASAGVNSFTLAVQQSNQALTLLGSSIANIGIVQLGISMVRAADQLNRVHIALQAVYGSAELANSMMDRLSAIAARSPFEFADIGRAAQRLGAFGVSASKVTHYIDVIQKQVALMGGTSGDIQSFVTAFGRLQTTDIAQGLALLRTLPGLGVRTMDILKKGMEQLHPGQVFTDAQLALMIRRGQFAGRATMDAFIKGMEEVQKQGGLDQMMGLPTSQFTKIKDELARLSVVVEGDVMPWINKLLGGIRELIVGFQHLDPQTRKWIEAALAVTALAIAVTGLVRALNLLFAVGPLLRMLSGLFTGLAAAARTAFAALQLAAEVGSVTQVLGALGPEIAALSAALSGVALVAGAAAAAIGVLTLGFVAYKNRGAISAVIEGRTGSPGTEAGDAARLRQGTGGAVAHWIARDVLPDSFKEWVRTQEKGPNGAPLPKGLIDEIMDERKPDVRDYRPSSEAGKRAAIGRTDDNPFGDRRLMGSAYVTMDQLEKQEKLERDRQEELEHEQKLAASDLAKAMGREAGGIAGVIMRYQEKIHEMISTTAQATELKAQTYAVFHEIERGWEALAKRRIEVNREMYQAMAEEQIRSTKNASEEAGLVIQDTAEKTTAVQLKQISIQSDGLRKAAEYQKQAAKSALEERMLPLLKEMKDAQEAAEDPKHKFITRLPSTIKQDALIEYQKYQQDRLKIDTDTADKIRRLELDSVEQTLADATRMTIEARETTRAEEINSLQRGAALMKARMDDGTAQTAAERVKVIEDVARYDIQTQQQVQALRLRNIDQDLQWTLKANEEKAKALPQYAGVFAIASEKAGQDAAAKSGVIVKEEADYEAQVRYDAYRKANEAMIEDQKKIYEQLKSGLDKVWDALFDRSQSVWASIGKMIKTTLLNTFKEIVTSRVAGQLMEMFGGQKVTFEQRGQWDQSTMGQWLGKLTAKPTFQSEASKQAIADALGDPRLRDNPIPVWIMNPNTNAKVTIEETQKKIVQASVTGGGGSGGGGGGGVGLVTVTRQPIETVSSRLINYAEPAAAGGGGGLMISGIPGMGSAGMINPAALMPMMAAPQGAAAGGGGGGAPYGFDLMGGGGGGGVDASEIFSGIGTPAATGGGGTAAVGGGRTSLLGSLMKIFSGGGKGGAATVASGAATGAAMAFPSGDEAAYSSIGAGAYSGGGTGWGSAFGALDSMFTSEGKLPLSKVVGGAPGVAPAAAPGGFTSLIKSLGFTGALGAAHTATGAGSFFGGLFGKYGAGGKGTDVGTATSGGPLGQLGGSLAMTAGLGLLTSGLSGQKGYTNTAAQTSAGGALVGMQFGKMMGLTPFGGALLGGSAGLWAAGLKKGGWGGFGMDIAGGAGAGAVLGLKYGGPIGAAIGALAGAAAGAISGGIRMAIKTPIEQIRDDIKQVYGIEINSPQILGQIQQLAKEKYFGSFSLAVRSPEVQQMVHLYSLSTGQQAATPRPMYSATFAESGAAGGAQLQPVYSGGQLVQSPYSGTTTTQWAQGMQYMDLTKQRGQGVFVQLDKNAAQDLFEGRVVSVIGNNPGAVSTANAAGLSQSSARAATRGSLLEPFTVMS